MQLMGRRDRWINANIYGIFQFKDFEAPARVDGVTIERLHL